MSEGSPLQLVFYLSKRIVQLHHEFNFVILELLGKVSPALKHLSFFILFCFCYKSLQKVMHPLLLVSFCFHICTFLFIFFRIILGFLSHTHTPFSKGHQKLFSFSPLLIPYTFRIVVLFIYLCQNIAIACKTETLIHWWLGINIVSDTEMIIIHNESPWSIFSACSSIY